MQRETIVWLILMLATIFLTYSLDGAAADPTGLPASARNALILLIAFVKVRIVCYEFMEIRFAPRLMRIATYAWIIITCGVLLAFLPGLKG